ncbi:ER membrane protein complex subunit 8 [Ischnura elegans]|uniref:ER membrane protein complex subunit 8 n=1 Tax=Ischnura elegans TaxID=197161 RepID=UPI001ED89D1B|nr:ER membrane protein complex subunit 8 [Ischnura elegans]XP_046384164.1 ER membrane protein complex subunit 8 [Ischnura elegans]
MAEVKFSARAYCKIILHVAKYPHAAVNGILLAEEQKSKDGSRSKGLNIVDAVPLFHLCLHVSPMAEIALTQIDHLATSSSLVVAGYYLANENLNDISADKPGHRIADKIAENFSAACLVVVDNRRLSLTMEHTALIVSQYSDGKWKTKDRHSVLLEGPAGAVQEAAAILLQRNYQSSLVDFDNHLDDVSLDWLNPETNEAIEEAFNACLEG